MTQFPEAAELLSINSLNGKGKAFERMIMLTFVMVTYQFPKWER